MDNYINLFRTHDDIKTGYTSYNNYETKPLNCHDGQRKLLYSEIEFYSLLKEKYDLNNILVVYAGAAEGTHEPVIFDLFPELEFYLCDPNPFNIPYYNKAYLENTYYEDNTFDKIKERNKKNKNIVFVSDIRGGTNQNEVHQNMLEQQFWVIQSNCIAYMLKMRLPFPKTLLNIDEKYKQKILQYDIEIDDTYDKNNTDSTKYLYLQGQIYYQIWSQNRSPETRLIHIKDNINEKFKLIIHNTKIYDMKNYYYNKVLRNNTYKYKKSNLLQNYIYGYDESYECVCEYYICEKYLNTDNYKKIIKCVYDINNHLEKLTHKNKLMCIIDTFEKNVLKMIKLNSNIKEFMVNYDNKIKDLKKQINNQIILMINKKKNIKGINVLLEIEKLKMSIIKLNTKEEKLKIILNKYF